MGGGMAAAYKKAKRYTDALDRAEKAISLDSGCLEAHLTKAQLLLILRMQQELRKVADLGVSRLIDANQIDLDCLRKAQQGYEESRSLLAQRARGKVYAFINRMTLDHDLSEDLTQETLLELIRALPRLQLRSAESFWSWVYRTALGKVQHHFRRQGAGRIEHRTRVNSEILETMSAKRRAGPAATLWRKETVELILAGMGALKLEYRTVLTLRCLEDQSYAEIAALVGGSQMRAKMSFYRARTALRKQLDRKGLKRSHFLGALTVFATMTCDSARSASAIPAVTATSAKAGAASDCSPPRRAVGRIPRLVRRSARRSRACRREVPRQAVRRR